MKTTSEPNQSHLFEIDPINTDKSNGQTIASYIFDILDAVSAPILTFSHWWADTIPHRMLQNIPLARILALRNRQHLATEEECAVYIYTRTLDAPMDQDWTEIYCHLCCKVLQKWFHEDHWKEMAAPSQLTELQIGKLHRLRNHLYQKRREILKASVKAEQKESGNKPAAKSVYTDPAAPPVTQQASFDF